jgi:hypothetical protein
MQSLLNLAIAETVGQRQNQASTEDATSGQTAPLRPPRQLLTFEEERISKSPYCAMLI